MRLREWKYEDGEFTYSQRIELGQVFQDDNLSGYGKLKQAWKVLYGWSPRWMNPWRRYKAFDRMLEGLKYWIDRERNTLHYEPTAEEHRAGLLNLSREVGELGTVKALAEKFGVDPDIILTWKWGKVYGMLYADMREAEYQRRLFEQSKR